MPDPSGAEAGQAYVRACRTLLDPASPGDALTAYYLLTHPVSRSRRFLLREVAPGHVVVEPGGAGRLEVEPVGDSGQGQAVLAICDTGPRDHPLVVLRAGRPELVPDLVVRALPHGLKHYVITRPSYRSALDAVFSGVGDQMETVVWRPGPATRRIAAALPGAGEAVAAGGGSPRLETYAENGRLGRRLVAGGAVVSSATILWESDRFAEVGVSTAAAYRRRGYARVVVGALLLSVLDRGLTPLYIADKRNLPSLALAASLGLAPTGHEEYACSGSVIPRGPHGRPGHDPAGPRAKGLGGGPSRRAWRAGGEEVPTSPDHACGHGWRVGCGRTDPAWPEARLCGPSPCAR